jgi:excisionase family DNA binding protein
MQNVVSPTSCDLLTYVEAAKFLSLPVGTLYAWVDARRIPHFRLGIRLVRFSRVALEEWLAERTVAAREPLATPRLVRQTPLKSANLRGYR